MLHKLLSKDVSKRFLKFLLSPGRYCKIYGHKYLVDINKERDSMTIKHVCYCGRCRTIFGFVKIPYTMYVVKGVNPQYGTMLTKWFKEIGMLNPILEKLVANLQKFRHQTGRKIHVVNNITNKKENVGKLL